MSQFLSRKFLTAKQREIGGRGRITADLPCASCGYNLKGLNFGRNCPECGTQIEPGAEYDDILLQGGWSRRSAWRLGLGLLFVCLLVVTGARWLLYLSAFVGVIDYVTSTYVVTLLLVSFVWLFATWTVTPGELARFTLLRHLRHYVRLSQILWPVAMALWLVGKAQGSNTMVEWAAALRFFAGTGVLAMIVILMRVSVWAELDDQAARLNAVLWLLPITTLLVQAMPGGRVAWFTLIPMGLFLALWAWVMLVFAFTALRLQRHVAYAMAEAREAPRRQARISEKQQAMERELESRVRPVGPNLDDLPLDPPRSEPPDIGQTSPYPGTGYDDGP